MTKIEEILNKHRIRKSFVNEEEYSEEIVILIMKEYAEYYTKKCLEIVIDEYSYMLDRDCVLSLKLPEHI